MTATDTPGCDALFLAAHPDDAEICCGGTILRLVDAGQRIVLVDMSRGEMGSRGDAETRAAECAAATARLGVSERINLGLPDAGLDATRDEQLLAVVQVLRSQRPRLLFAHLPADIHPDHVATGRLAQRAWFLAGLAKFAPDAGSAFRPERLIHFPANDHAEPSFCIDISAVTARKRGAIECYGSQVNLPDATHFARKQDPLQRSENRDRYFGGQVGCAAAEPFVVQGPWRLDDPTALLGR